MSHASCVTHSARCIARWVSGRNTELETALVTSHPSVSVFAALSSCRCALLSSYVASLCKRRRQRWRAEAALLTPRAGRSWLRRRRGGDAARGGARGRHGERGGSDRVLLGRAAPPHACAAHPLSRSVRGRRAPVSARDPI